MATLIIVYLIALLVANAWDKIDYEWDVSIMSKGVEYRGIAERNKWKLGISFITLICIIVYAIYLRK